MSGLALRGMNVSIYNHQLCLLRRPLWRFARKSISDFKNIYLETCQECAVLEECGGLFKSSEQIHSHAYSCAVGCRTHEPRFRLGPATRAPREQATPDSDRSQDFESRAQYHSAHIAPVRLDAYASPLEH